MPNVECAEAVLALSGARREQAMGRIDQPLRVWRQAAVSGLGLLSSRIWF
ncbi:hypothetical protein [Streptomyces sp. MUSC 14]|nr:hypothetical protein [Streptomyces sp. MUSC 14]